MRLGLEAHGVLIALAGHDEPRLGDSGVALDHGVDLFGVDEHPLDLGGLVGASHPALDAQVRSATGAGPAKNGG